ncbi:hypothetical protein EV126DRAFT_416834 [Verticillium dahliae]|nr:hypothetical protein EV126DRAFT_416834 [Verticillium dahliae]
MHSFLAVCRFITSCSTWPICHCHQISKRCFSQPPFCIFGYSFTHGPCASADDLIAKPLMCLTYSAAGLYDSLV